ncbi:MAG: hypothetical protein HC923_01325, partial [Myxococcales bacterium]|nr:hypothetical protein [Myxococcales bacterium]
SVADRRGFFGDDPRGGAGDRYALSITRREVAPRNVQFPFTNRLFPFDDARSIVILDGTVPESTRFTFLNLETDLGSGSSEFGFDTILVVDVDGEVRENDDVGRGFTDSQLTLFDLQAGLPLRVVIDHARRIGPPDLDYDVTLSMQQNDLLPEIEPNDTPNVASPVQYPNCPNASETTLGGVGIRDTGFDDDWYRIDARAGDILRLGAAQRDAQSTFRPIVQLAQVRGGAAVLLAQISDPVNAFLPFIFPSDGAYLLRVNHEPNLAPMANPVGGPLFDYAVTLQCLPRFNRPETFTRSDALSSVTVARRDIGRFSVAAEGPAIADVLVTSARTGTDPNNGPFLAPEAILTGPEGKGLLGRGTGVIGVQGSARAAAFLENTNAAHLLAVSNPAFEQFSFKMRLDLEPVTPVAEVEPNDQANTATLLATLPTVARGELVPESPDFYRVTLNGPVDVFANGGDTILGLQISRPNQTALINATERILGFNEGAGEYIVRVTANLPTDYTLIITDRPANP